MRLLNNLYNFTNTNSKMDQQTELAKIMYDTYCKSVGGKAFNGDDLPGSEEFFNDASKGKQSKAWIDAASSAIDWFNGNVMLM